ncbi:Sucrase/ferredoxin-like-domain-containing protein [Dissophora ornata]|nr:Sucrase/ferredoxin-like-domain-containing protein [Dissophora ornata]
MFLKAKRLATGSPEEDLAASPFVSVSDCHGCESPCQDEDHPHYPSFLKINQDMPLLYSVKPYTRHVLISTGKEDWESHIDDDKSSLAYHLSRAIDDGQRQIREATGDSPDRIILTNSSRKAEDWNGPGWQVIVLPDQIVVNNVTADQCNDFFEAFLKPSVGSVNLVVPAAPDVDAPGLGQASKAEITVGKTTFIASRWQPKAAIMICSHKRRDKRCGVTAPILKKEFTRILRSKDLYGDCEGDVEIWMISHIGGHKFAGNVIVHKTEGLAVWYGRVEPCHSQAIVEATVERGEVIRELYRGSMNGSFDHQKKIAW